MLVNNNNKLCYSWSTAFKAEVEEIPNGGEEVKKYHFNFYTLFIYAAHQRHSDVQHTLYDPLWCDPLCGAVPFNKKCDQHCFHFLFCGPTFMDLPSRGSYHSAFDVWCMGHIGNTTIMRDLWKASKILLFPYPPVLCSTNRRFSTTVKKSKQCTRQELTLVGKIKHIFIMQND